MAKLNKRQIYDLVNETKCELYHTLADVDVLDKDVFLESLHGILRELEIIERSL